MHHLVRTTTWLAILLLCGGVAVADENAFRQIASLLESRCIGCHNAGEQAGGLDLTSRVGALAGGDSGESAYVASSPDDSLLLQRIAAGEMPPAGKGTALTEKEVEQFASWISAGAVWPADRMLDPFAKSTPLRAGRDWWSLQPVVRPPLPHRKFDSGVNSIDVFVHAKLAELGLEPSPPADKRTLLRRVTFDLIGLPPTPAEVEAFLADESPRAYERVVDRLLASPQFGERWARHWLDVAHYADTHGFERDFRRDNAWPYRDWVIDAINSDMPYNDFLVAQIAGDVAHPGDRSSLIATGFLAAGPWDFVGHEENKDPKFRRLARAEDLDDMVTTVMSATIGLTVNCARCHDHKFDPIPQRDYYNLWAVFAGAKRGERELPSVVQQRGGQPSVFDIKAELTRLQPKVISLADIVAGGDGRGTGQRGSGLDVRSGEQVASAAQVIANAKLNHFQSVDHPLIDGVFVPFSGDDGKTPTPISSTGLKIEAIGATTGKVWDHIRTSPSSGAQTAKLAGIDYAQPPLRMLALHANKGITFDLAAIRAAVGWKAMRLRTLIGYGGAEGEFSADVAIYVDGQLHVERRGLRRTDGALAVDLPLAAESRFLTLVATDAGNDFSHDQVFFAEPLLVPHPLDADVDAAHYVASLSAWQDGNVAQNSGDAQDKVYTVVPQSPEEIRLLFRGETESPRDVAAPGALSCVTSLSPQLGDVQMDEGDRRLALAKWIADERNPLTRRVIVNRLWHHHFGQGIVDSPSDFGFLGGQPSHRELLDWLAAELAENRWSLKHLHRLIVVSNVYRQSSQASPAAQRVDAQNRWLWRMSPRRLEAEAVRDAVLAVSGSLNERHGGPGYRDFQFIDRYAPIYRYMTADRPELWRRTIYRFTVRSVPQQFMEVLDCPNPSVLSPRRAETTTSLQSLSLLNDPFMTQQAHRFAERVAAERPNDPATQVERAFFLALAREPTDDERRMSQELVETQGIFHFCRVLLNVNEFIHID